MPKQLEIYLELFKNDGYKEITSQSDFDNFINNLCDVEEIDFKLSYQDLRKLLDLLIYNELRIQNNGPVKFGGMARSFSKLKSALNLWMKQFIKTNPPLYEIICNDLLKDSNIFAYAHLS